MGPSAKRETFARIHGRYQRPARMGQPKKGLGATTPGMLLRHPVAHPWRTGRHHRPGTVAVDTVAHCDDSTAGDHVDSLTFTELSSGWTENRAVRNKGSQAILGQMKEPEARVPFVMSSFHSDNRSEFLN